MSENKEVKKIEINLTNVRPSKNYHYDKWNMDIKEDSKTISYKDKPIHNIGIILDEYLADSNHCIFNKSVKRLEITINLIEEEDDDES